MLDVDRLVHEPARLAIMTILYTVEAADFLFLKRQTGLTKGNLSSHLSRLEGAGYVAIEKTFEGKIPRTICRLTDAGRKAFEDYRDWLKNAIKSTESKQK
ncbi:MAG: transcriptional regulator [Anaerolineae bacterium]|nr:transcriptional regulator [Anaerolineae bacterium]